MTTILIKRVYETPDPNDGFRVLVDRVWPRGMTKEKVHADLWLKEIAPSTAVRSEFCHDPALWEPFKAHYFAELDDHPQAIAQLLEQAAKGTLTLLYSARETQFNQAAALQEYLLTRIKQKGG